MVGVVPGQLDALAADFDRAAVPEGLLGCRAGRVVLAQQQATRVLVTDARDVFVEQRGGTRVVGVVVGVNEVRDLIRHAVGRGDLIDGPLDIVADGRRRVEHDDTVRGRQERGLVGAVGDPVEVALDPPDVVPLLVEGRTQRGARDRGVVGKVLGIRGARVGVGLGRRIGCAHLILLRSVHRLPVQIHVVLLAKSAECAPL